MHHRRRDVGDLRGDFRGALFAVEHQCGDCEEMSALFVSMCRLSGVTARTVWVEGHNYPEFYLGDKSGQGHWIPVQVVGPPPWKKNGHREAPDALAAPVEASADAGQPLRSPLPRTGEGQGEGVPAPRDDQDTT